MMRTPVAESGRGDPPCDPRGYLAGVPLALPGSQVLRHGADQALPRHRLGQIVRRLQLFMGGAAERGTGDDDGRDRRVLRLRQLMVTKAPSVHFGHQQVEEHDANP